jgi:hypothetical protein
MRWDHEETKANAIILKVEATQEPVLLTLVAVAKEAVRTYHDSLSQVEVASGVLDQKMAELADEDAKLDATVQETANIFIGSGFTARTKPFGSFTSYSPSRLCALKMASEIAEIQRLVSGAAAAHPPEPAVKAIAQLTEQSSLLRTQLDALSEPQDAFDRAAQARTEAGIQLKRVMKKLRLTAELTWQNDAEKIERIFAPPEEAQDAGRHKRKQGEAAAIATRSEIDQIE